MALLMDCIRLESLKISGCRLVYKIDMTLAIE